jgi:hypothetical protein
MSRYQELISTGIVLTVVTGGIAGSVMGYALNGVVANRALVAVTAAFVAVLVARLVRHFTIVAAIREAGPGPGTSLIPGVVLRNALGASVLGGLSAYSLGFSVLGPPPAALTGCLAGVIAGVCFELLMIGYHPTLARSRRLFGARDASRLG